MTNVQHERVIDDDIDFEEDAAGRGESAAGGGAADEPAPPSQVDE